MWVEESELTIDNVFKVWVVIDHFKIKNTSLCFTVNMVLAHSRSHRFELRHLEHIHAGPLRVPSCVQVLGRHA